MKHYENKKKGIKIVPIDPEHTDAIGIVKFAKQYIDKHDIDVQLGDKCYCVFDSDPQSNPDINTAFNLIQGYSHKGLSCIFSNPCFEIWFILHYQKAPHGKTAEQTKEILKKLLEHDAPNYKETTDIFNILQDKQEQALKEALLLHQSQAQVHKNVLSHACNPYTNIFEFIQYIQTIKKVIP